MKTNKLYLTGCLKNVVKILFKLPKCPPKEYEFKKFIEKIETFTGGNIMLIDLWSTRNTKSLFPFKDKVCIDLA